MGPWKVFRLFLFFGLNNNFTESIHIPKFYLILFYHSKKLLYQLYYTILQYSQHLNFYFTIQHIRITFLHNKIIYPKTQIKTKAQKPRERENKILVFFFLELSYIAILPLELHCSTIAKFFAIVGFYKSRCVGGFGLLC